MRLSLKNWLNNGWLKTHTTSSQEISNLIELAERDILESTTSGLSPDWKLTIAYNAALQTATAALAATGYRATRESHHFRIIQSLEYTIGADKELIILFDNFRRKRNISGYDRSGTISMQEANEMKDLAEYLYRITKEWLEKNHSSLLKFKLESKNNGK